MKLATMLAAIAGCDEPEQQRLNRSQAQVAEASQELVQADAKARSEMVAVQRDLQQGQAELSRQRDQLENDRRQYAEQRNRDPIVANTILDVGILIACLLPLLLGIVIVLNLRDTVETDSNLTELLVEEIAGNSSLLLPTKGPAEALEHGPHDQCLVDDSPTDSA